MNEMPIASHVIIIMTLCFFLLRGLRIYWRSDLKGELIRASGIALLIFALIIKSWAFGITGFIVFHVGWIILLTIEYEIRREIYQQITLFERVIGNTPQISNRKTIAATYPKAIGITVGILCIIVAFISYKRLETFDVMEIVLNGVLFFGGIFVIAFYLLKKG